MTFFQFAGPRLWRLVAPKLMPGDAGGWLSVRVNFGRSASATLNPTLQHDQQ